MEDLFSSLPYFNPMMMVNTSGTCATTRLIQCRDLGVYTNDVSRKFQRSPEDAPDLSRDDFLARKKIINQVSRYCADRARETKSEYEDQYVPILYLYELVKASAKRERDWGHLVFTDMTTTRFLVVMIFPPTCNCGNFSHHDYDALTKYQADRFFSLLTYLHHKEGKPNWVRATYTTSKHGYAIDSVFLNGKEAPTPSQIKGRKAAKLPPIFHVTPETFVPSLLPGEVEKIDNLLAQRGEKEPAPQSVRDEVLGTKEVRPEVSSTWKAKHGRQCAYCQEFQEEGLMLCAKCKLVYYCSKDCQRYAWPTHKRICKKSEGTQPAPETS